MKKSIFTLIANLLIVFYASAQLKVGNNPTNINASAALEVEATNKGFLPPRVALTGTKDATTIPTPAAGLLVINTATAGSGTTAVVANTLYIWDGSQWNRIVTNNGNANSATNPFVVGETRSCLIKSDPNAFINNGGSRIIMNGKASTNTTSTNRNSASETSTNNPSYILFRGLRMDFLESAFNGGSSPKLFNTTANPITYNVTALSTNDRKIDGAGSTIVAGAYSWDIDGNDDFSTSFQGNAEYVNAMITFPDGEWYLCTWHAVREANFYHFYMTAQRLN